MIKVMHVLNTGSYSGAENVVITLINATKQSVASTYVSLEGPIRDYLSNVNIDYYSVSKLSVFELRKAINTIEPDIIHAHDFTAGIMSTLTGTKVPIINHLHNNSPWMRNYGIKSFVYAISCSRYNRILTVSNSVMDEYVFGKKYQNKTNVIGNPIDIERIKKLAGQDCAKRYDIAYLGRLTEQKNPFMFLNIIKEIKNSIPSITAIMIGDGELRADIEEEIATNNLQESITMVGFQQNPYAYLNQARLLLMPSSWEGFGLAAVEALAIGLPVICSQNGGLPLIVNDKCGKCCNGIEEYTESIIEIMTDSSKYSAKSSAAKQRAESFFNLKEYSAFIETLYADLVQAKNKNKQERKQI